MAQRFTKELHSAALAMDAANGLALVIDRVKTNHLLKKLVQLGVRRRVQRDLVERLEQV